MSTEKSELSNIANRLLELVGEFANNKKTVFAQKAGIPKGTFYGYLKGGVPHVEHLVRIQETFFVSIDWILTGRGQKYIHDSEEKVVVDQDPQIARLIEGARRVLTSGNHVAFDALERNIIYFDHAIEAEKRADEAEKEIAEIKEKMKTIEQEFQKMKRIELRQDAQGGGQSSGKKAI